MIAPHRTAPHHTTPHHTVAFEETESRTNRHRAVRLPKHTIPERPWGFMPRTCCFFRSLISTIRFVTGDVCTERGVNYIAILSPQPAASAQASPIFPLLLRRYTRYGVQRHFLVSFCSIIHGEAAAAAVLVPTLFRSASCLSAPVVNSIICP